MITKPAIWTLIFTVIIMSNCALTGYIIFYSQGKGWDHAFPSIVGMVAVISIQYQSATQRSTAGITPSSQEIKLERIAAYLSSIYFILVLAFNHKLLTASPFFLRVIWEIDVLLICVIIVFWWKTRACMIR